MSFVGVQQEAAIFLQEGFENDRFEAHPTDASGMQAYRFVHSPAFHVLDLVAAILLMLLALVEEPAVGGLEMPIQVKIIRWSCCARQSMWWKESGGGGIQDYDEIGWVR